MLVLVPASMKDDATVHQNVIKQEKYFRLGAASTQLHQPPLAYQDPVRSDQGHPRGAEGVLHCLYPLSVLLRESQLVHHDEQDYNTTGN